jgi:hypothetical protein
MSGETGPNPIAVDIYVQLLNEGSTVWRPTKATPLGNRLYRL